MNNDRHYQMMLLSYYHPNALTQSSQSTFFICPYSRSLFSQEDKIIQLFETMMSRHCTMVVGPTGGGKTNVINTLIKAQCHLGVPTKCTFLNPKVGIYLHSTVWAFAHFEFNWYLYLLFLCAMCISNIWGLLLRCWLNMYIFGYY